MRAPFAYYGGKSGMAGKIVAMMPPHRVYIEPYFGSGAVLFRKPPAVHEIVNDIDRSIVTFMRVLRDRPDELERVCWLTPHARVEFDQADLADDTIDDLERARRLWVRINQSFAKNTGAHTGWSVTTARSQSVPASIQGKILRFGEVAGRLLACSIECCHAPTLITRLATDETVVYVDPPYLATTRRARGGDRQRTADYHHDMGEPDDHRELAGVLHETPATVILSGYPSPLYEELYGDWWHTDLQVTVHSSNSKTAGRDGRVERLWSNRPHAGQLELAR